MEFKKKNVERVKVSFHSLKKLNIGIKVASIVSCPTEYVQVRTQSLMQ